MTITTLEADLVKNQNQNRQKSPKESTVTYPYESKIRISLTSKNTGTGEIRSLEKTVSFPGLSPEVLFQQLEILISFYHKQAADSRRAHRDELAKRVSDNKPVGHIDVHQPLVVDPPANPRPTGRSEDRG